MEQIFIFFFVRTKSSEFAEAQLSGNASRYGGVIIGALRSTVVVYLIVLFLNYVPFGLFNESLKESKIAKPLLELIVLQKKNHKPVSNPEPFEYYE